METARTEDGFQVLLSIFAKDQIQQDVQSLTGNEELEKMAEVALGPTAIVGLT